MPANARQPSSVAGTARVHYERHRPEQTELYRLVQNHAASFFAQVEQASGVGLPKFVRDEFEAFLECGILAHGFLRLRCADCTHDKLVAFSCKRRGFCPSCGARRMAETAAHLVDHVIPNVPVRQWVLSLPIGLRLLLASQPQLLTPVLQVVQRVLTKHLLDQAGLKQGEGECGSVTLIQRFSSAANLNIHLHCLVLDGVYRLNVAGEPEFVEVSAPSDVALVELLRRIIRRLMKHLVRRGILVEEQGELYMADPGDDSDEAGPLRRLQVGSAVYRIAFGERAGQIPVVIYVAELDRFLVPKFHAERIVKDLPSAELRRIGNAWHFAFMDAPTSLISSPDGDIRADPPGFDRGALLKRLAEEIPAFFDKALQ